MVGQQGGECGGGAGRITRAPPPPGELAPGGEGVGVVRTEEAVGLGGEVVEVVAGGGGLAGFSEASAGAVEHGVGMGLVEGVFGGAGEDFCVGAQGLGEVGVAFDGGPGGGQGVGGGARELVVPAGGEGIAGGALGAIVKTCGCRVVT
jgi:hypothetical protein